MKRPPPSKVRVRKRVGHRPGLLQYPPKSHTREKRLVQTLHTSQPIRPTRPIREKNCHWIFATSAIWLPRQCLANRSLVAALPIIPLITISFHASSYHFQLFQPQAHSGNAPTTSPKVVDIPAIQLFHPICPQRPIIPSKVE